MTCKKAMQDAKTKFDAQVQDKLHAVEIRDNGVQELQKMNDMEVFVNNPVTTIKSESDDKITQVELEELALSFSD
jgi:translation elongation factor P/translation initiation factor 5A